MFGVHGLSLSATVEMIHDMNARLPRSDERYLCTCKQLPTLRTRPRSIRGWRKFNVLQSDRSRYSNLIWEVHFPHGPKLWQKSRPGAKRTLVKCAAPFSNICMTCMHDTVPTLVSCEIPVLHCNTLSMSTLVREFESRGTECHQLVVCRW